MTAWTNVDEAMKYFGVATVDELEDIVVEFDLDTIVADDGRLLGIQGADEMKEALFERFKQQFGHRPDDPVAHGAAVALHHQAQAELKAQRKADRIKHVDKRVKARKEARDGRTAAADTGA
jgi:hypothetical protein